MDSAQKNKNKKDILLDTFAKMVYEKRDKLAEENEYRNAGEVKERYITGFCDGLIDALAILSKTEKIITKEE